ncbi:class II D-tagatose-bisphosphate aldolase, non-catalytic subunit [Lentilitoribacter sp. Alg239-R112]|uniref:class II D-tagatose-bisphosphate aldolase non-catalytic subunit n=1 Tax=Lentilitoribacter sp. Alg239-R112 TaxID=2305987 RepID=UPI0013A6BDE2|nr:class II D-tagatose-bisphosphate aldolase, non-catalytic subunit [Lentilitoribacter sp. Alg239-R112]
MDLKELVRSNRVGECKALPSICTANESVLGATVAFAAEHKIPALIEATCNQVNQFGGYTGLRPADYAKKIRSKAETAGLPQDDLILGGDHLGPNPWKHLDASNAMENAKVLVKDFVEAGFTKIHLDASMACANESTPSFELVAQRSAELCQVAEAHAPDASKLCYVIGTEVPIPGGETDDMSDIQVTTVDNLAATINTHIDAFEKGGVPQGIEKSIAVVVQPGVDFSHDGIFHYDRDKAVNLTQAIGEYDGIAFEAHSTDYQSTEDLSALVADHSVILKVGPEITFRFRESIMALDQLERQLGIKDKADVIDVVLSVMDKSPADWKNYYQGDDAEIAYLKLYSLSDRVRYYWDQDEVKSALAKLMHNLDTVGIRSALATQLGSDFPSPEPVLSPRSIIDQRICTTLSRYYKACGLIS